MKKNAAIFASFIALATIPVSAQDVPTPKCPETRIVLQHKDFAIKLTLNGIPTPVTEEGGSKRCPTFNEIIKQIKDGYPDYSIIEYSEQG